MKWETMIAQMPLAPEMIGVPVLLLFLGWLLKQSPYVTDWIIPFALTTAGVVFGIAVLGLNVAGVTQGIIVAALAIAAHQKLKQFEKR